MSKDRIKDRDTNPTSPKNIKNKFLTDNRMPRPRGLTNLSINLTDNTNRLTKLREYIIGKWVHNNLTLNNRIMNMDELGDYIQMSPGIVMRYMVEVMKDMGKVLNKVEGTELARALFSHILKNGLEIQAQHQAQVGNLLASQGARYQPFISMAVNQSLANLNATQGTLLALLKTLTEKNVTNILIHNETNTTENKYLTTDEAVKLIGPNQISMIEDPSLAQSYILSQKGLPDVGARTQDLRGIGIRHDGTQNASAGLPEEPTPRPKRDKEDRIPRNTAPIEILNEEDFTA